MSRKHSSHAEFGSDSFLDVLANMVGILIVLIVIAGIRVARGPVPTASDATAEDASAAPLASAEVPPLEPESDAPAPEVTRELKGIEAELARLRAERTRSEAELKDRREIYAATKQETSAAEKTTAERQKDLDDNKERLIRLQQKLGDRKEVLTALLAEFEEAKNARAPVTQVKHRLAPISQEVHGDEVHFRLSGNKVSVIPLPQLLERVKFQLERQKDWVARHGKHEAVVGPVDGYSLKYLVERMQLSPVEERRMGYGAYRVGLAYFELVPEPDLPAETAEQALRRGSRFAIALQSAPEKAALTFWVYPDSFGLYRALKEAAHAEGFIVAGRPLPEGLAIRGDPNGSRSAGQ
ncbi:MAG TPA: hypothetical protein VL475_09705 [Planctomycetaceae bacterium]|nr:hypothetical protein [Planctomycetaceae bacterium]